MTAYHLSVCDIAVFSETNADEVHALGAECVMLGERVLAGCVVEGELGSQYQHATATNTAGNPSIKNRSLQLAIPVLSPIFTIAQAKLLAKLVARGAAETNSPVLKASSSRRKKKVK